MCATGGEEAVEHISSLTRNDTLTQFIRIIIVARRKGLARRYFWLLLLPDKSDKGGSQYGNLRKLQKNPWYCNAAPRIGSRFIATFLLREGCIERTIRRSEVDFLAELAGFCGTGFAIHPRVFPFNRQRHVERVLGSVQSADDLFEIDFSPTDRTEVPATTSVAERQMARQDSAPTVEIPLSILHVYMVDAVWELADEVDWVYTLPNQMRRVEVEAELWAVIDCQERPDRSMNVERNLGRVDLQRESHTALSEHVQDGIPAVCELLIPCIEHRLRRRWKVVNQVPDTGSGEPIDDTDTNLFRSSRCILHRCGCSFIDTFRLAVAPNGWGEDRLVTGIDVVAHRLPNQMIGDGEELQIVLVEQVSLAAAIAII